MLWGVLARAWRISGNRLPDLRPKIKRGFIPVVCPGFRELQDRVKGKKCWRKDSKN